MHYKSFGKTEINQNFLLSDSENINVKKNEVENLMKEIIDLLNSYQENLSFIRKKLSHIYYIFLNNKSYFKKIFNEIPSIPFILTVFDKKYPEIHFESLQLFSIITYFHSKEKNNQLAIPDLFDYILTIILDSNDIFDDKSRFINIIDLKKNALLTLANIMFDSPSGKEIFLSRNMMSQITNFFMDENYSLCRPEIMSLMNNALEYCIQQSQSGNFDFPLQDFQEFAEKSIIRFNQYYNDSVKFDFLFFDNYISICDEDMTCRIIDAIQFPKIFENICFYPGKFIENILKLLKSIYDKLLKMNFDNTKIFELIPIKLDTLFLRFLPKKSLYNYQFKQNEITNRLKETFCFFIYTYFSLFPQEVEIYYNQENFELFARYISQETAIIKTLALKVLFCYFQQECTKFVNIKLIKNIIDLLDLDSIEITEFVLFDICRFISGEFYKIKIYQILNESNAFDRIEELKFSKENISINCLVYINNIFQFKKEMEEQYATVEMDFFY